MLQILHHPDARLYTVCAPVQPTEFSPELQAALHAMLALLPLSHPGHPRGGIGLAGPQVGDMRRILVMQVEGQPSYCMCNPTLTEFSGIPKEPGPESCLSFLDLRVSIPRYTQVGVTWQDPLNGERRRAIFSGLEARVVQHEVDHLDGRTILDHARPAARRDYMRRYGAKP